MADDDRATSDCNARTSAVVDDRSERRPNVAVLLDPTPPNVGRFQSRTELWVARSASFASMMTIITADERHAFEQGRKTPEASPYHSSATGDPSSVGRRQPERVCPRVPSAGRTGCSPVLGDRPTTL